MEKLAVKGMIALLVGVGFSASAGEIDARMDADLRARAEVAAMEGALRSRQGLAPEPGSLEIISLKDYPAPAEYKRKIESKIRARSAGPTLVAKEKLPDQNAILANLTPKSGALSSASQRGVSAPLGRQTDLSKTPLKDGVLLGAVPTGKISSNGATGVSRTFRLTDGSLIEFSEDDYVAAGTKIRLIRETLNTNVNGSLGIISSARAEDGSGRSMLHWVTPKRSYRITRLAQNNFNAQQSEALLRKIAAQVSE